MIDLHNHILPGLDDGAADLHESIEIARQFVSEGVVEVAATPHLDPERGTGAPAPEVRERVEELQQVLAASGIDLRVTTGNELYLTPDALSLLEKGVVSTLGGGKSVLVELSLMQSQRPLFLDDTLFRLQLGGYQPVLAHPERYGFVQYDISSVDGLVDRGVVLQLTAPALLGEYGGKVRKTAELLLQRGSYSAAASDRHHPGPPRSLAALHDRLARHADADLADLLLSTNPARLLAGKTVIQAEGTLGQRGGFLARLLGRGGSR